MPFGPNCEYADFQACVSANQDKDDPEAWCASLQEDTEESCKSNKGKEHLGENAMTEFDEGTVQLLKDAAPARLELDVCRIAPNISVRATDGGDGEGERGMPVMEGHFSTFNDWYEINNFFEGNFLERIAPGAFKRTFNAANSSKDKHRIQVLLEHGFDPTVGDKPLGTPDVLEEDTEGARFEVPLFDTSYNRDLIPALDAGVYGSSFRFQVLRDEWVEEPEASDANPKGLPERTIKEVRVAEFGPTVFPANPSATAGTRSTTDEFYEKLRTKNKDRYKEVIARAAQNRGVSPELLLGESDDHKPALETEVESQDESLTEDSQSEHSEDSRSEVEDAPPTHSTDSQDEGTPSGESDSESRTDESEDSETRTTCVHAFCEKRRTGENSERSCFFKNE